MYDEIYNLAVIGFVSALFYFIRRRFPLCEKMSDNKSIQVHSDFFLDNGYMPTSEARIICLGPNDELPPEYSKSHVNVEFQHWNSLLADLKGWTPTPTDHFAVFGLSASGTFLFFPLALQVGKFIATTGQPLIVNYLPQFASFCAHYIGIALWKCLCYVGRVFAYWTGWKPDDWLMFRVFYEYFLIYDWDKRTFKYLVRLPESFWGKIFRWAFQTSVIAVPVIIFGALCLLWGATWEQIKQAVCDATPTLVIWGSLIAILHRVYPYFVWWPRPILWVDYGLLLGLSYFIASIPSIWDWFISKDIPKEPVTPSDTDSSGKTKDQ